VGRQLLREALDRLGVRLNMYLVNSQLCLVFIAPGTDSISLLIIVVVRLVLLVGAACDALQKSPKLRRFKSDRDEIWQDY